MCRKFRLECKCDKLCPFHALTIQTSAALGPATLIVLCYLDVWHLQQKDTTRREETCGSGVEVVAVVERFREDLTSKATANSLFSAEKVALLFSKEIAQVLEEATDEKRVLKAEAAPC